MNAQPVDSIEAEEIVESPDGTEPELVGEEAIMQGVLMYEQWELQLPPIPAALASQVKLIGPGLLGTHPEFSGVQDDHAFYKAAASGAEEVLTFGQCGNGTNSLYLCYCLIFRELAVSVHIPFGGVYTSAASAARRYLSVMSVCEELLDRCGEFLTPNRRLVVTQSDRIESRWGVVEKGAPFAAANLTADPMAAFSAIKFLDDVDSRPTDAILI